MNKLLYYIEKDAWEDIFIDLSKRHKTFAPCLDDSQIKYKQISTKDKNAIYTNPTRLTTPIKHFFFPPFEKNSSEIKLLYGIKACDLNALIFFDKKNLTSDKAALNYKSKRENTIIISTDCTNIKESCFCLLLGKTPFPQEGFDINISFAKEGFIIELGSERGANLLKHHEKHLYPLDQSHLKSKDLNRLQVIQKLKDNNTKHKTSQDLSKAISGHEKSQSWKNLAKNCLNCAACRNICPTCNFFVTEQDKNNTNQKQQTYHKCTNKNLSIFDKFKNRFYCKFEYHQTLSCTGCGRCIEACPNNIDIREILAKFARA
jgi:sulfhydrogenase subunit beta (sulfur reductase)